MDVRRWYERIVKRIVNTRMSNIPGVKRTHMLITYIFSLYNSLIYDGEWIEYDGVEIFCDTYDSVGEKIYLNGKYESDIKKSIETYLGKGDFAIDIGSHIGHHAVTMRNCVGSNGEVWLFEPNPKNVDYLNKTIKKNGWENVSLFPVALSNTETTERLIIPSGSNTGKAGLHERNIREDYVENADNTYKVKTKRLSAYLEGQTDIDLIKIDVEGGERDIITDIQDCMDKVDTILLEFHPNKMSPEAISDTFRILNKKGRLTDLDGRNVTLEMCQRKTDLIWQNDSNTL